MIVIRNNVLPLKGFHAMNFFGVLFCRNGVRLTPSLLRHELIHTRQMWEMLIVGFYVWYVAEWLVRLFLDGDAYGNIGFEREAYAHMHDARYLEQRHPFAWRHYLCKTP